MQTGKVSTHDRTNGSRLQIRTPVEIHSQFREDVATGLQCPQKTIPPKYFYDAYGSLLFEQICQQPEYYLTRTETTILREHTVDIVDIVGNSALVELGSGSAVKTRLLFDEYQRRGMTIHYVPIDISASMLEESARNLMAAYPRLQIDALATDYWHGLAALPNSQTRLVLFLGSNLGNFTLTEQAQLFAQLARTLHRGDYFLVGLDLRKPITVLEPAYNDAAGVTAAFNLNLLHRMNRELAASFNLSTFTHLAFYNSDHHQIEMHLQSTIEQEVTIADLQFRAAFRAGETIHTEISRKFDAEEIRSQLVNCGFSPRAQWTDKRGWFRVSLFQYTGQLPAQDQ
jgi:dimethylhistidine N-methyltransferase